MSQTPENLRGRESDMKKEADFHIRADSFTYHLRDEKEVVVVDPDCVAALVVLYDDVGDGTIYGLEVFPRVVQKGPSFC